MAFASYWKADAVALAVSRAQPADPQQYQRLHNLVEGLCIASGLPKPGVYIVDDPAPNAFATGRNPKHAAHRRHHRPAREDEPGRARGRASPTSCRTCSNYDILVSTLAVTLVGAIALLTDIGDPDDVVERRPGAPRGRPQRRQQPAGHHRARLC